MLKFLNEALFVLKPVSAEEKEEILQLMLAYLNPLTGSVSGVEAVYKFILLMEKNLANLLDSFTSSSSIKTTTYGKREEQYEKLTSKSTKDPKNIIKLTTPLRGVFDTNSNGDRGYEYFYAGEQGNPAPKSPSRNRV